MKTLPDWGAIVCILLAAQKVVDSSPAECTSIFLYRIMTPGD
jgi:hypothetical protein